MVQPEERVEGRGLQGPHVASTARLIMNLVVHVFETTVTAGVRGGRVEAIITEAIKIVVGQEQKQYVAAEGSILVGEDGSDL